LEQIFDVASQKCPAKYIVDANSNLIKPPPHGLGVLDTEVALGKEAGRKTSVGRGGRTGMYHECLNLG
jgi:hypothetical protein